ncbi:MAG: hypothetical protein ACJ8FS_10110 [Sphingomicrobium sp.]
MQFVRPAYAIHPRLFGRAPARDVPVMPCPSLSTSDDLKLFAVTFLAGFVFVSILIG